MTLHRKILAVSEVLQKSGSKIMIYSWTNLSATFFTSMNERKMSFQQTEIFRRYVAVGLLWIYFSKYFTRRINLCHDFAFFSGVHELPKHEFNDDGASDFTLSNSSASNTSSRKSSNQCINVIPRLSYDPQVRSSVGGVQFVKY